MKWHSIKEYTIPANNGLMLVALNVDDSYVYKLAQYTHNIETDKFYWTSEDGNILLQVTHFCIPDPIPKAYGILIGSNKNIEDVQNISYDDILIQNFFADDKYNPCNYFSDRIVRNLNDQEIDSIGKLLSWCEHYIYKIPNLGKKSVAEIKSIIKKVDLELGIRPGYTHKKLSHSKCQVCLAKEKQKNEVV